MVKTIIQMNKVYHSSNHHGFKVIKPGTSTHGENWVYATKELAYSALFLSSLGGDLTCQIGSPDSIPTVTERFQGAFDERYKDQKGSIYVLSDIDFQEGKTGWDQEVVSPKEQNVLEEIIISDAKVYLQELERNKMLRILLYPARPYFIPEDDQDLVEKCVRFTTHFGLSFLDEVRRFHPRLLERVQHKLNSGSSGDSVNS